MKKVIPDPRGDAGFPLVYDDEPVTYEPPQPNAALVVGPDDHLVISLPVDTDPDEFEAFQNALYTRLPRDQVTVVCGAEQIAVIRNVLVEAAACEDGHSPPE